jgi:hypothetical protein
MLVASDSGCGSCGACGVCGACALCGEINAGAPGAAAAAVIAIAALSAESFDPVKRNETALKDGATPSPDLRQFQDTMNRQIKSGR